MMARGPERAAATAGDNGDEIARLDRSMQARAAVAEILNTVSDEQATRIKFAPGKISRWISFFRSEPRPEPWSPKPGRESVGRRLIHGSCNGLLKNALDAGLWCQRAVPMAV